MAIKEFDVFVIGTGSAGKRVAYDCAAEGLKVAITDDREFGGTCANRGCDPKKVLVGITEAFQLAENLKGKGIPAISKIDWPSLREYKSTFTDAVPAVTEKKLKKAGITMYHQSPVFLDKNTLSVEGKTIITKKIVIASGLKPLELTIPGREFLKTSDDFFDLPEIPKEIVFVGGGYIGMEFAHIAARCGAKVTLIHSGERPLKHFEKDIVDHLMAVSEDLGIQFILNAQVVKVEKLQKNFRVHYKKGGTIASVTTQMVFNTAGRVPSIDQLDLDKGNVNYDLKKGVAVNEYLQSPSNPSVYACGDVSASGTFPLTPTSNHEARIASINVRKNNSLKMNFPVVPSVVFTIPQIATIGLTEDAAKEKGLDYTVKHKNVPNWFNAKHRNEKVYAFKTILDKKTDTILGAHIITPEAGEIINLFAMAINAKLTTDEIKAMIFAYPTWGHDMEWMI